MACLIRILQIRETSFTETQEEEEMDEEDGTQEPRAKH
jgi:hypothetical protein